MSLSATQRQRLAYEKSLLEKYFKNRVAWIDPTEAGKTKAEVLVTCSNDMQYILRVDDYAKETQRERLTRNR